MFPVAETTGLHGEKEARGVLPDWRCGPSKSYTLSNCRAVAREKCPVCDAGGSCYSYWILRMERRANWSDVGSFKHDTTTRHLRGCGFRAMRGNSSERRREVGRRAEKNIIGIVYFAATFLQIRRYYRRARCRRWEPYWWRVSSSRVQQLKNDCPQRAPGRYSLRWLAFTLIISHREFDERRKPGRDTWWLQFGPIGGSLVVGIEF